MKVLITGGAGFLGIELCRALLKKPDSSGLRRFVKSGQGVVEKVDKIVLFDVPGSFDSWKDRAPCSDSRVSCVTGSIEDAATLRSLIDEPGMSVFHLAGIMSGQGEKDFDLCLRVNLDGTRQVLEACRAVKPREDGRLVRVVFASSAGAFGETQDCPVSDSTKLVPHNTYGMTKAMGEMLVNDYTRKGFIDGCSARLPTVIVRPGKPNAATTSCFSGVIREPLSGVDVALPVDRHLPHAVSSTRALITNLQALHDADFGSVGSTPVDRAVTLPSTSITLQILVESLHRVVPSKQHDKLGRISDAADPFLSGVVKSMACKEMSQAKALKLGLKPVPAVDDMIREYIEDFGASGGMVVSVGSASAQPRPCGLTPSQRGPGQVAVITGAGTGVGRAAAAGLLRAGFRCLVLVGRREGPLRETAAVLRKDFSLAEGSAAAPPSPKRARLEQVELHPITCDVTKSERVTSLFQEVAQRFGRCDLLFNNAGCGAAAVPCEDLPLEAWRQCLDTNVTGSFLCAREAMRLMKQQRPQGGRIINNGSVSADRPRPFSAPYTASKHAVTGLTKSLALDGRHFDIACGQLDIGNALTEMSRRLGESPGALQPPESNGDERRAVEPLMDVKEVGRAVEYMASLPLDANVLFMTVMATKMPLVGRG